MRLFEETKKKTKRLSKKYNKLQKKHKKLKARVDAHDAYFTEQKKRDQQCKLNDLISYE